MLCAAGDGAECHRAAEAAAQARAEDHGVGGGDAQQAREQHGHRQAASEGSKHRRTSEVINSPEWGVPTRHAHKTVRYTLSARQHHRNVLQLKRTLLTRPPL